MKEIQVEETQARFWSKFDSVLNSDGSIRLQDKKVNAYSSAKDVIEFEGIKTELNNLNASGKVYVEFIDRNMRILYVEDLSLFNKLNNEMKTDKRVTKATAKTNIDWKGRTVDTATSLYFIKDVGDVYFTYIPNIEKSKYLMGANAQEVCYA